MHATTTNSDSFPQAGAAMVLLAALVIGGAFILTEHYLSGPQMEDFAQQADDIEAAAAEGSSQRRLGFLLVGLLGVVFLARTARQPFCVHGVLPPLLLFCLAWCAASALWSSDVALTVRRLGPLVFCFVGAVGVGRQFSLRQLCLIALMIMGAYVLLGLGLEIRLNSFTPWQSDFRFAGTVHPNLQGTYCAAICLAAICLLSRRTPPKILWLGLSAAGIAFLLLTKSRTSLFSFLAALAALAWVRSGPRARFAAAIAAGFAALALFLALQFSGPHTEETLFDAVLMGRSEAAESLTGRIPLWVELFHSVKDRLWIGFGYGAFWDADHIETASSVVGSGVSHAHSAYMETLVNTGLVGVVALTLAAAAGLARAARGCRHARDAGSDFLFALLTYGAVQSLSEPLFASPGCVPFLAACGLAPLALVADDASPAGAGGDASATDGAAALAKPLSNDSWRSPL